MDITGWRIFWEIAHRPDMDMTEKGLVWKPAKREMEDYEKDRSLDL